MKHLPIRFFLLFILAFTLKPASAQINTEAIDAYWAIVDLLRKDKDPAPETWNAFFEKPGNVLALNVYRNAPGIKDTLKNSLALVYKPTHRKQLEQTKINPFLENIIYTRDQEAGIKEYMSFVKKGTVVDTMYKLAHQYLPPEKQTRFPGLKIYYIGPVTLDSRALKDAVFINVGSEYRFSPKRSAIVGAHEMHHMLLNLEQPKKKTNPRYAGLVAVFKSLLSEGTADLIDKKYILLHGDSIYHPMVVQGLQMSDSLVRKMNTEIERLCQSPDYKHTLRNVISRGGHVPGHFMALVIERNGFLPELLKNIENPFAFVYIYNKAAAIDKYKPATFSPAAIGFLQGIEKMYQ